MHVARLIQSHAPALPALGLAACLVMLSSSGCVDPRDLIQRAEALVLNDVQTLADSREFSREEDPDRDGLSTAQEAQLGTDPHRADTDADFLPDKTELTLGTDPLTPNREETIDGVPSAFDGLILPGESRTFFRGTDAVATAYVRIMGLVRSETTLRIDWFDDDDPETATATTQETMQPRQYWYWGHDLGPSAIVNVPARMTLTHLTITVEEGGDSVFYSFVSSGGLDSGPRGFVPFSSILAEATFDFNLLMAHGAYRNASGWDSLALMLERIAPEVQVIRTSVDPQGRIERRAGQLSRYVQREGLSTLYIVAHSQGGLDSRYILTSAAFDDPHYSVTAESLCGLYTLGTPHRGLELTELTVGLPPDLFVSTADGNENPSAGVIEWMNDSFPGDVLIGDRVIPVIAFAFHSDFRVLNASDGIVKVFSQAFGDHIVNDVVSTRGVGPGSGKHVASIPSRADVEQDSFFVLGRILEDIVTRRAVTDGFNPCP